MLEIEARVPVCRVFGRNALIRSYVVSSCSSRDVATICASSSNHVSPSVSSEIFSSTFLPCFSSYATSFLTRSFHLNLRLLLGHLPFSFLFKTFFGILSLFILKTCQNIFSVTGLYLFIFQNIYLLLLLQGYRPQACFRLQENASPHLAMGRPIFLYPLDL
jgi:hypothetical protein